MLAASPRAFARYESIYNARDRKGRRPYIVNNRGLYGEFPMLPHTPDTYLVLLPCSRYSASGGIECMGIFVCRLYEDDQYIRVPVDGKDTVFVPFDQQKVLKTHSIVRNISIRQSPLLSKEMGYVYTERQPVFRFNEDLLEVDDTFKALYIIDGKWDAAGRMVSLPPGFNRHIHHIGSIDIGRRALQIEVIRFGFDPDWNPVIYITQRGVQYSEEADSSYPRIVRETFRRPSQSQDSPHFVATFQNGMPTNGTPFNNTAWLYHATARADVDGLWVLKADRLSDYKGSILSTSQPLYDDSDRVAHIHLTRKIVGGCLIWDLEVDDIAPLTSVPGLTGRKSIDNGNKQILGAIPSRITKMTGA